MFIRPNVHLLNGEFLDEDDIPEQKLLRAVLGRAIYDLKPEANHAMRRDAIAWFRDETPGIEKALTSFANIKLELSLSGRFLTLLNEALREAVEYEHYYTESQLAKVQPDVKKWLQEKKSMINSKQRPFTPHVRYSKVFP